MSRHRPISIFSLGITLALLLGWFECIQARHSLFDCNVQYKCSGEKEYVWATDEERCHIIHNRCLLKVEQCARRNQGKSELVETDRETCKQNCEKVCMRNFEPVCAQFFQEEYITFSNECEMRNYMCTHERAYSYYAIGECVESPSSN
ncbi:GH13521 [Drosophila grimshawi]|uniref:GH13521 n=2 Tax=Drosophila grimshawi TaxID=7222 RepID=B4JTV4_DROGR|nr:GH13521 [Drosophila grimshawi]